MAYSLLAPWIGGAGSEPVTTQGGFTTALPFFRGGGGGEPPEAPRKRGGGGHGSTLSGRYVEMDANTTDDEALAVVAFLLIKEKYH